jgi:asparagine synthase (glutamine-hydrolysing)
MCGIAGAVDRRGGLTRDGLLAMAATLSHRGPNAEEAYVSPDGIGGLAHRRLSIIDLAGGGQPMCNEDGSVWIAFNGEIYNDPDLRRRLQDKGHVFKTQSDTESIVHLYEEEGEACVEHLRGMFAFAIWDVPRRRLLLARDRMGKKPLFYTEYNGTFVFGSELKALLAFPRMQPEVDWSFLDAYLALGYLPAPMTPFRCVQKLPQAHCLTLEAGKSPRVWQYWQPQYTPKRSLSEGEALEELDRRLHEAVRIRLRSDVPFGAFLSGGVDSGTVVALMSRHLQAPVKTFSIGFEEDSHNELPYARQVAQRAGTEHHEAVVRMGDLSILPELARHLDEPFADSSALPTYHVSRNAAAHVTMVLSGDGGDELFGGYTRYANERRLQRVAPLAAAVLRPFRACLERHATFGERGQKLSRLAYHATLPFEDSYEAVVGNFSPAARRALLRAFDGTRSWLGPWLQRFRALPLEDRMMAVDLHTYLSEDVLVKVDRMSMANSLEVRAPLLDHEVVEFAASLPVSMKLRNSAGKYLLKRYAEGVLTPELVHRKKQGFSVPLAAWFRGDAGTMLLQLLDDERELVRELFRLEIVLTWLQQHRQGAAQHQERLWAILMVLLWYRTVVKGRRA